MSASSLKSAEPRPASSSGARDVVLLAAFTIFAGAMGAILHVVLEVQAEIAALAALCTLSVLVAINAVARRASLAASLDAEIADLKAEIAALRRAPEAGGPGYPANAGEARMRPLPASAAGLATPPPLPQAVPRPRAATPGHAGAGAPRAEQAMAPGAGAAAAGAVEGPHLAGHEPREPAMAPYWTVRPGTDCEPGGLDAGAAGPAGPLPMLEPAPRPGPSLASAAAAAASAAAAPPPPAPSTTAADRSPDSRWPQANPLPAGQGLDIGTMQSLIEQLSAQLNQPRLPEDAAGAVEGAGAGADAERRPAAAALPFRPAAAPAHHQAALPPAPVGRLALIAEAVEADRIDVYLDPILGLADRKARHFELSVRLLTEMGDELGADDYMGPAAGTGLLARIDAAKLARAAEVAERLKVRRSRASLFSSIAGESLADENFIGAFADILDAEEGLGPKLVLTFTQADVRAFTDAHWDAVTTMAQIGIKLALEDVRDLDMDFSRLRWHGFEFVKLDAAVFLEGLATQAGHVPAADICRHLAELGLGLIVGGIIAEKDLARILGFGVLLGQGTLFGAPRSVQLDLERKAA